MTGKSLGDIADRFDLELVGDPELVINGVGTLAGAGPDCISFLANSKYLKQLHGTRAAAVILAPGDAREFDGNALLSANPYLAYARIATLFDPASSASAGVNASAVVDSSVQVPDSASVGAGSYIGPGCTIGEGVVIGPNCTIEDSVQLGAGTRLVANVFIGSRVSVGERNLLHPGTVVGADGFGQAPDAGKWVKVPQLGSVILGNDVEIGANTTIDRGAIEDTIIEDGVRLDNQIQVAHNVHIGAHTAIAGCTAIAGSTRIGRHCMIAGGVGIAGHLEIVDEVTVLAMTFVTHSISQKGVYAGSHPMEDVRNWRKNSARIRQLDDLARRLRKLEKNNGE